MSAKRPEKTDTEKLMQAVLSLQTEEEAAAFFADLCTPRELKEMSLRLDAAEDLLYGATYEEIRVRYGLSSATVARIKAELEYGGGGYKTVLERLGRQSR